MKKEELKFQVFKQIKRISVGDLQKEEARVSSKHETVFFFSSSVLV